MSLLQGTLLPWGAHPTPGHSGPRHYELTYDIEGKTDAAAFTFKHKKHQKLSPRIQTLVEIVVPVMNDTTTC